MRYGPWNRRSSEQAGARSRQRPKPLRQRGIALVIVLWGLTLLSVVAASFLTETRTATRVTRNLILNAQAEALADAGVHRAMLGLLDPPERGGWRVDGTLYAWRFGEGEVWISIADEGGKIDLNHAPDGLLRALFRAVDLGEHQASTLVDAIADYRDRDTLLRLNGAEDEDYEAAGLPHEAKDAPFDSVDELQMVIGMTGALYARVAPLLTVYARRRFPDIPAASPEVKRALSLAESEFPDEIQKLRAEANAREGNAVKDDDPRRVEDSEAPEPSLQTIEEGSGSRRSRVSVYTIRAEARMDNGAVFVREAVVRLTPSPEMPFRFYAWRQGRLRHVVEENQGPDP